MKFSAEPHTESAVVAVIPTFVGVRSENTERQVTIGSRAIYRVDGLNKVCFGDGLLGWILIRNLE